MAPFRGAFTQITTTNTGVASLVVGGATGAATTGTGGINSGPHVLANAVPAVTTNALYNNAGALFWNGSAVSVGGGGAAGATADIQFNNGGLFAADTGVFTYTAGTDTLGVNNIAAQPTSALTVSGGNPVSGTANGGNCTVSGGAGIGAGAGGGTLTLRGGTMTSAGLVSGSVVIKSGDINAVGQTVGSVTITSGAIPVTPQALGTLITVRPVTPTGGASVDSGVAGGGVVVEGGAGQPNNGFSVGGAGGPLALAAGAGATVSGSAGWNNTGGTGGGLTLTAGVGGNAPDVSANTHTGGNGGNVIIGSGAAGTGSDANGTAGTIAFNIGATTTATVTAAAVFSFSTGMALTGVITPTQLVANTNDWNPTGLSTANVVRVDSSGAINLTGIVAQTSGRMLVLYNAGAFDITLIHDATSTAVNRFFCPNATDFTLSQKESTWLRYDTGSVGSERWTVMGTA